MSDIDDCQKAVKRLTRDRGAVMRDNAGGRTMSDKIEEIKRRHLTGERYGPATAAHDDRATLLAEVERLREALRWYGTRVHAFSRSHDPWTANADLMNDGGGRARKALEGAP